MTATLVEPVRQASGLCAASLRLAVELVTHTLAANNWLLTGSELDSIESALHDLDDVAERLRLDAAAGPLGSVA